MTAVERSDRLDRHLMVVSRQHYYGATVALAVIVALCLASWVMLLRLSRDNHRILTSQLPGLQHQIVARDRTIADDEAVIGQATAAIIRLAAQVKALGGDPGQIVLKPPKHPKGDS